MENLALTCTLSSLIKIIEEVQTIHGQNITPHAQQLTKLPETDYNKYTALDKLKFLIIDNKPIDLLQFKNIIAQGDKDKLELATFYNDNFANTLPNTLPNPFYFKPKIDAELDKYYYTKKTIISGFDPNKLILIKCTDCEVDAGTPEIINKKSSLSAECLNNVFSSQKLAKSNNEGEILIVVKAKSSNKNLTNIITKIDINGIIGTFSILTKEVDNPSSILPTKFEIPPILDADLNTDYISDPIIISGFFPNHEINILAFNGLIDAGPVELSGNFEQSKIITSDITGRCNLVVKGTSSTKHRTYTETIIYVNGYQTTFDIRTKEGVVSTNNNYFINRVNTNPKTKYISNEIIIDGLQNILTTVSCSYSTNANGAIYAKLTSDEKPNWTDSVNITPVNHSIIIRASLYSSNNFNTETTLRLYLNGILYDIFSIKTKNGPTPFSGPSI